MGFLDPKRKDDEELPGSGLHLDLEVKRCPVCRRETLPWETTCPDCGVATVPADQLPARDEGLPDLSHLATDDGTPAEDALPEAGDD
jgi:hypothetical protein